MSVSAGRYIEDTIPDWLIRGLDDLGGWSIAKLIRVVLPYLYLPSLSIRGRWCQFRSDRPCASLGSMRTRWVFNPFDTRIYNLVPFLFLVVHLDKKVDRNIGKPSIGSLSTKMLILIFLSSIEKSINRNIFSYRYNLFYRFLYLYFY